MPKKQKPAQQEEAQEVQLQGAAPTAEVRKLDEYFKPDKSNANLGTARGTHLLEESLQKYGAGRSILLDREGNVVAGNKTLDAAVSIGLEEAIVIDSDGSALIAVQREDLDMADRTTGARGLAIADNRTAQVGLRWDPETLVDYEAAGAELEKFWNEPELNKLLADIDRDLQIPATMAAAAASSAGATADLQMQQPNATGSISAPQGEQTASEPLTTTQPMHNSGGIRMLQLYVTNAEYEDFKEKMAVLQAVYETNTDSETVREAIRNAHAALEISDGAEGSGSVVGDES